MDTLEDRDTLDGEGFIPREGKPCTDNGTCGIASAVNRISNTCQSMCVKPSDGSVRIEFNALKLTKCITSLHRSL